MTGIRKYLRQLSRLAAAAFCLAVLASAIHAPVHSAEPDTDHCITCQFFGQGAAPAEDAGVIEDRTIRSALEPASSTEAPQAPALSPHPARAPPAIS